MINIMQKKSAKFEKKYLNFYYLKLFNQNKTSLFLMCVSVLMLTLFNVFWLRQNYREQQNNLQKDVTNIFEKTIASMQDSLIKKQVDEAVKEQKLHKVKQKLPVLANKTNKKSIKSHTFFNKDSIHFENLTVFSNNKSDANDSIGRRILASMIKSFRLDSSNSSVKIEIKLDTNFKKNISISRPRIMLMSSKEHNFSQLTTYTPLLHPKQQSSVGNVVIKLSNVPLKIEEISRKFDTKLQNQQIDLPFTIVGNAKPKSLNPHPINAKASAGLMVFQANFDNFQWFLTKKIIPQILFSFFLIAITTFSFLLIYKNLQQQHRLTALKNDFVSNVTHELKTPISTVSVAIEALSNFNVLKNPTQTKEYLEISKNELNRLTILVDKVLKMSIFEQKDLELKNEIIDFKSLIINVLSTMKLQFEKYKAQIDFDFTGNNFTLEGDVIHLTNVIYNLLENALKYSPEPMISIRLEEESQAISLKIQDNGIGISEEYLPKIFDKFFRVPTGDVHNTKGYGLGLSYVKSVVEKHRGTIEVSSKIGEGSCFFINLPSRKI